MKRFLGCSGIVATLYHQRIYYKPYEEKISRPDADFIPQAPTYFADAEESEDPISPESKRGKVYKR